MIIDFDSPTEEEKRESKKRLTEFIYNYKFKLYYERYKLEERNPLYVWAVYHLSRKLNISIPEWVLEYFDEVAQNLQNPPQKGGERISVFLQKALKMQKKGKGNIFKRYFDTEKRITVVWQIIELLRKKETLENSIIQISEETGMSEETLKKWYYHYREILLKPV